MHATLPLLIEDTNFPSIKRTGLETLQVNLGYRCNQRCLHCHVNAGPNRKEMMDAETLGFIMTVLKARGISTLDLTGGAPELHDGFRSLVADARADGIRVIDRCNLTILSEPGQEDLAEFLAGQQVEIIASLPCYSMNNVDQQRGAGVFDRSIIGLKKLNALGYGREGLGLKLNLVFNPLGPSLPPDQQRLQAVYKRNLYEYFGIEFNELYALANMPIKRFGSTLISKGQFQGYIQLLKDNYHASNLEHVMCRSLISVDWQGFLFDCDFNQQLGMGMGRTTHAHLRDLLKTDFVGESICVADHCFGCAAGQGSSCGGAL